MPNARSNEIARREPAHRNPAWIELDEVSLRYETSNWSDRCAPVDVLIHELGGSLESWAAIVPALGKSTRVLAYDQRGHGGSGKVRTPFTLDDHVNDLAALVEFLVPDEPFRLIAAAAGAAIAIAFAARHPARVTCMVMCAPALDVDPSRQHLLRERAAQAIREGMSAIVDGTLERSWPPVIRDDKPLFEQYRARFLANDPDGYAYAALAFSDVDLTDCLPTLRCPCLLLAGQYDLQRLPEQVSAQAALIPGAVYEMVPAGHLMAVQRPQDVLAKIHAFRDGSCA